MTRRALPLLAWLAIAALPSPLLAAPCLEGDARAAALDMKNPDARAKTMVGLGLWTTFMVKKRFADDLKAAATACERGTFEAAGRTYALRGDSNLATLARVALPESKKDPIGYLTTAPDLVAGLSPGHQGPAPVLGYALVTVEDGAHVAWRLYDKPPVDSVLLADFAQALSGQARPLMRWRDGKIEIFAD